MTEATDVAAHGRGARGSSRLADACLVVILVISPLPFGTVHVWSTAALGVLAITFFAAVVAAQRHDGKRVAFGWLGWLLLAAAAYPLVQLVPLPPGLLRVLSPAAWDLRGFDVGWTASFAPLALEPPAAALGAARRLAAALVFLGVANRYAGRERRPFVLSCVSIALLIFAMVAVVQLLFRESGGEDDLGLLRRLRVTGPFVNPNHAAAYLSGGAFLALALAATAESRARVLLGAAAAAASLMALPLTFSRGGILALVVGAGFLLAILIGRTVRKRSPSRATVLPMVFLVLGPLCALAVAELPLRSRLQTIGSLDQVQADTKLRLQRDSREFMREYARVGAGEGGFAPGHFRYRSMTQPLTFTHIENEYLQAVADHGYLFGAVPIVAIAIAVVVVAWRRRRSAIVPFVLAALVTTAVHGLGDFAFATGAVTVLAFVLLGLLVRRRERHDQGVVAARGARLRVASVLGVAALAVVAALLHAPYSLARDTRRIRDASAARAPDFESLARAAANRHAADYVIPLLAVRHYGERDLARAAAWANRALFVAPKAPDAHRTAAGILVARGAFRQALGEYRLAYEYSPPERRDAILDEVLRLRGRAADVLWAASDLAEAFRYLQRHGEARDIRQAFEAFARARPHDPAALRALLRQRLGDGDLAGAEALLPQLRALGGGATDDLVLELELLRARGDEDRVHRLLAEAQAREPRNVQLMFWAAEDALRRGDLQGVLKQTRAVWSAVPDRRDTLAHAFVLGGRAHEKAGDLAEAIKEFRRAVALDEIWVPDLAAALERAGRLREALAEYRRAAAAGGPGSEADRRARALAQQLGLPP